jgi:hypothetical protein
MHGGPLLNSWDFDAFHALWFGHCGLYGWRLLSHMQLAATLLSTSSTARGL